MLNISNFKEFNKNEKWDGYNEGFAAPPEYTIALVLKWLFTDETCIPPEGVCCELDSLNTVIMEALNPIEMICQSLKEFSSSLVEKNNDNKRLIEDAIEYIRDPEKITFKDGPSTKSQVTAFSSLSLRSMFNLIYAMMLYNLELVEANQKLKINCPTFNAPENFNPTIKQ